MTATRTKKRKPPSRATRVKTFRKLCISNASDIENQMNDLNIYDVDAIKDVSVLEEIKTKLSTAGGLVYEANEMIQEYSLDDGKEN